MFKIFNNVNWNATMKFMGVRLAAATVVLIPLYLMFGPAESSTATAFFMAPVFAVLCMCFAFFGSFVVKAIDAMGLELPATIFGFFLLVISIPFRLGDPLVRLLHKSKPEFVPVDDPGWFNPPLVLVYNT